MLTFKNLDDAWYIDLLYITQQNTIIEVKIKKMLNIVRHHQSVLIKLIYKVNVCYCC